MFPKETLAYGISQDLIVVEAKGKAIFKIEVTDEFITLSPVELPHKKTAKKLEQFIEASLLPAEEL